MAENKMTALIEEAERDLLHTYNRYQIVLDHGDGVYLYDVNGKRYLDFVAGIAVFALGYNNKEYNDALKAQIDRILHTSNYFYNEPAILAAKALKEVSGMDRVFFTNSGAEAVEGALKAAMKHDLEQFKKLNGMECVECGSCSFICPAKRQLAQSIKTMKKTILAERRKK